MLSPRRIWPRIKSALAPLATASAGILLCASLLGCDQSSDAPVNSVSLPTTGPALPELPPVPSTIPLLKVSKPVVKADPAALDVPGPLIPDKYQAKIVQTVSGFDHPLGLAFSTDSKTLFVTNTAHTGSGGMRAGGGSISKLSVGADGRLTMLNVALAKGLDAPTGIAVLPKATKLFPAGTLFVSTGATFACDAKGEIINDYSLFKPGITLIDPDTGAVLGFIPMGPKTAVAKSILHPVLSPAGLSFDSASDLFMCDSGNTGQYLDPKIEGGNPGILRIRHRDIDNCVANDLKGGDVAFLSVRFIPVSILFTPLDKGNFFWACAGEGPSGGSVWRTAQPTFGQSSMVGLVIGDLGPLTGLAINSKGACFMSRVDGDIVYINRTRIDTVRFAYEEQPVFSTPGAIKFHALPTGETILYLPEQEPGPINNKQRLRVILMPSGV